MRPLAFVLTASLFLSGCSLFKTPEPDLFRAATFEISGNSLGEPFGIAHRGGDLYVSDGETGRILKITDSGAASVYAEGLGTPSHIAFDEDGYLLVADSGSHTIKRVRAGGDVEVLAGVEGKAGYSDGAASEALFRAPVGLAVMNGDIYVADTYNDRIRVIRNGQVTTVAGGSRGFMDGSAGDARFDTPTGIIATRDNRILVADSSNGRIRSVGPDGTVTTIAGGTTESELEEPSAFTVSEEGDVFFTDGDSVKRIRRQDGIIETVSESERGYSDSAQSEPRRFNRPTGLAIGSDGALYVADSDNRAIRVFSKRKGTVLSSEDVKARVESTESFKAAAPGRWPYEIPDAARDVAGTFGEIRGAVDLPEEGIYFHNGLDIAGAYGERAHFVRSEKVLRPIAAANFGTLREYLRMPTLGYVHIRLGRDQDDKPFGDPRFLFDLNGEEITDVRVPRGSIFNAGEVVGTLNAMNHVHLVVGRRGYELNGLAALDLPGVSDTIVPTITDAWLEDADGNRLGPGPIGTGIKLRVVVEAHDRMDGNPERRRLGIYRAGYSVLKYGEQAPVSPSDWSLVFDALPGDSSVPSVYARGSVSGPSGGTVFRYLVTNRLQGASASEVVLDTGALGAGSHRLRVYVADFFGNSSFKDLDFEIK